MAGSAAVVSDRHGRISVRIALQQTKSQGHASAALTRLTTTRPLIRTADLTRKCGFFDRK
jgi:hypothetical protein